MLHIRLDSSNNRNRSRNRNPHPQQADQPEMFAELYAAEFAVEEFAPWTLLNLLGGTYTTVLEPREYPGLEAGPWVET